MNDACDCCELDDEPCKLYMNGNNELVRLCDACLDALTNDGVIEP